VREYVCNCGRDYVCRERCVCGERDCVCVRDVCKRRCVCDEDEVVCGGCILEL